MKKWILRPEASVALGKNSVFDRSVTPHILISLHSVFEGWLGDHILSRNPSVLVSEPLGTELKKCSMSGMTLADVEVTKAPHFQTGHGALPKFFWLKITGDPDRNDFGISAQNQLIVSDQALAIIRRFPSSNCTIEDQATPLSAEERRRQIYEETLRELEHLKGRDA